MKLLQLLKELEINKPFIGPSFPDPSKKSYWYYEIKDKNHMSLIYNQLIKKGYKFPGSNGYMSKEQIIKGNPIKMYANGGNAVWIIDYDTIQPWPEYYIKIE